ncbi:hypothetical protein CYV26_15350 [Carnobacterium maltaromaticum]|uniref:putative mucin/carbohydrate-binding domain-containing protein n=1 Tax=Carnobacterium maltaromaticum TaxID=2751 RepID=UPI000C786E16|nr:putative mucin/carbohydrate-binding domain-containing protein [Carnobacterium maltaromaticum]PLS32304.1 hypothetical protein CYV33_15320 [Carnobacterium maltaromaticum]PLS32461.1 hypothetical protein CYV31_15315 [Carnobacterium maltaromaticum]PLS32565.1 hypothetical protein CYV30_15325 [Carnobacterium maltaromaticum]PLS40721.1 hypothetical protein CYV28_15270 [Carnobacterium maltaromaticum]PLS41100.1 hypothetical protein CYV27_15340 [Carnobacterium maltaromaticum]
MTKNKKITCFCIMLLTSMFLFFCNASPAKAAYDSNISIPLFADGLTVIKNGQLELTFSKVNSEGTLTYVSSGKNLPFHKYFPGEKYIGISIIRDGKVIYTNSVNGDTKQTILETDMNNFKVKDRDILHFYLAEPDKEVVTNFEEATSLSTQFRQYFQ